MNKKGIVRNIDPLGRLVIPKEMRDELGMGVENPVEIKVENNAVVISKYRKACSFCGNTKDLNIMHGKNICLDCINEIKEL